MRVQPRYADAAHRDQFFRQALQRIRALPGVLSAGFVNQLPFKDGYWSGGLAIEGRQIPADEADVIYRPTSGDYLQTLGARLRGAAAFPATRSTSHVMD